MKNIYYRYTFINEFGLKLDDISSENKKIYLTKEENKNITLLKTEIVYISSSKFKNQDITKLSNSIYFLLKANLSLMYTLDYIIKKERKDHIKLVLLDIRNEILTGKSISETFKDSGKFSDIFINLIKISEVEGDLSKGFKRAYDYYEEREKFKKSLFKILTYPIILLIFLGLVINIIIRFVLPSFSDIYGEFGAELPKFTRTIINLSNFLTSYKIYFLFGILIGIFIMMKFFKLETIRLRLDRFKLEKISLVKLFYTTETSQNLEILLGGGIQLYEAFHIYSKTTKNLYLKQVINETVDEIKKGNDFIGYLDSRKIYPDLMIDLLYVGYENGDVKMSLNKAYNLHKFEFKNKLERMLALIEPVVLLLIGGVIVVIILGVILPMFNLIDLVM